MKTIFTNARFLFLWFSGMFVSLGFSIFFLTISWYTIDVLENPGALGVILTAVSLPRVVMMIFGGVLADRFQKSSLLFLTNILQSGLMVLLAFLSMSDSLSVPLLIILSVTFGMLDGISYPALSSLLPTIVDREELQPANSLFQGSLELMFVLGPFLAGLVLTLGGFPWSFGISAGLIAAAAILIFPKLVKDHVPEKVSLSIGQVLRDLREGISYVFGAPVLRTGTLAIAIVNLLVMGPIIMSIPIIVSSMDGTPLNLSFTEGGLAIGTFVASVVMIFLRRVHRGKFVFIALSLTVGAFLAYSFATSFTLLSLSAALSGFMVMLVYLPAVTLIQENTDADKIGRVMSIMSIVASGLEPIAFAVLSIFVALSVSIQTLLVAFALLTVISIIWLYIKGSIFRTFR